jgi:hypothetical protein
MYPSPIYIQKSMLLHANARIILVEHTEYKSNCDKALDLLFINVHTHKHTDKILNH